MKLISILSLAFIFGCAGASYSPYTSFSGKGYKEQKINETSFSVSFFGDGNNTARDVYSFFVKRSSDIARENSFSGFCIIREYPGEKKNGPTSWPYFEGDIQLTNDAKFDSVKCFKASVEVAPTVTK